MWRLPPLQMSIFLIAVLSPARIFSATIAFIGARAGTQIAKIGDSTLALSNTIIGPGSGANCFFEPGTPPIESLDGNLDTGATCGLHRIHDLHNTDPLLLPLAGAGGPPTHPLSPGSPAIDAGVAPHCPRTDQRGVARPQGAACDIGAYEAP